MGNITPREIVAKKKALLEKFITDEAKLTKVMGDILALTTSPSLKGVKPDSIIDSAIKLVKLDLSIDQLLAEAYVTAYNTKYGKYAMAQIGYKGYIKIAGRNGWRVIPTAIYKCDKYDFTETDGIRHFKIRPNLLERNEANNEWIDENLIGIAVTAIDPKGFKYIDVVSKPILDKLKDATKTKEGQIWIDWLLRMYFAKAIKYVLKTLPISERMKEALEIDDKEDIKAIEATKQDNKPSLEYLETPQEEPQTQMVEAPKDVKSEATITVKETVEAKPKRATKKAKVDDDITKREDYNILLGYVGDYGLSDNTTKKLYKDCIEQYGFISQEGVEELLQSGNYNS